MRAANFDDSIKAILSHPKHEVLDPFFITDPVISHCKELRERLKSIKADDKLLCKTPEDYIDKKTINIFRYGNRKIYSPRTCSYIKSDQIIKWMKEGYKIKIFDNRTRQDITRKVLIKRIMKQKLDFLKYITTDGLQQVLIEEDRWQRSYAEG